VRPTFGLAQAHEFDRPPGVSSVIHAPRREHSRKPDEAYERIAGVFGDVPRIELFARHSAPGWTVAGSGVDGLDIRESLAHLEVAR
jgi:N6-adenosine-specific RNA methylase IME4